MCQSSSSVSKEEGATAGVDVGAGTESTSMDTILLFQGACSKNENNLSVPSNYSGTPSIHLTPPGTPHKPHPKNFTPSNLRLKNTPTATLGTFSTSFGNLKVEAKKLTEFLIFGRFKKEFRTMIWRLAIRDIVARTVLVQPYNTNHPALADVCFEAREVFLEEYSMLHSRQGGRMSGFSISINYSTDLLYLNRRFVLNPKLAFVTPLIEASLLYSDWLKPVKQLALNLKDTRFLMPRAWGYELNSGIRYSELWEMIGVHCPELRLLFLVDNEAADLGTKGDLVAGAVVQPNRPFAWSVRWAQFDLSLKAAKIRGIVRQDLVLKAMDADKVVPEELII
ncbi:hypothetical protein ACEPPN_002468 [Leptodophora sp. 'Broadleaf-Isolate-01']